MKQDGSTELREAAAFEGGATWIAYPEEGMQRASHALAVDGEYWLVDPVDADDLDDWLADLGPVAGVVVAFNRHVRDADAIARRHDVSVHLPGALADDVGHRFDAPVESVADELADTGFEIVAVVDRSFWREYALYRPSDGTLLVPEAVGTSYYFRTSEERLGVHPALRWRPPRRALGRLVDESADSRVERVLVGHGDPVLESAHGALVEALDGARLRLPRVYARAIRGQLPV